MADIQQTIKDLQDTLAVTAAIQERHNELLKDHAEWLAGHDKAMLEIREAGRATDRRIAKQQEIARATDERIAKLQEAGRATDERIEALVSAIGKLITRKE